MQERRWLKEQIPALGGLTPVEAAADPSRVEQLERLLASFPDESVDDTVLSTLAAYAEALGASILVIADFGEEQFVLRPGSR